MHIDVKLIFIYGRFSFLMNALYFICW